MLRRLGYACLSLSVEDSSPRGTILRNATPERLRALTAANLAGLKRVLEFNVERGVRMFRLSSDIVPFGSHPVNAIAVVGRVRGATGRDRRADPQHRHARVDAPRPVHRALVTRPAHRRRGARRPGLPRPFARRARSGHAPQDRHSRRRRLCRQGCRTRSLVRRLPGPASPRARAVNSRKRRAAVRRGGCPHGLRRHRSTGRPRRPPPPRLRRSGRR